MKSICIAIVFALAPTVASGQAAGSGENVSSDPGISVLSLMPAEQFAAAGLTKLSASELQALGSWVRVHALQVAELARNAALNPEPAPSANPGVIETRMAGDFTGWDGGTLFQFANGQLWRQSSFGTLYQFAREPKVTLIATSSGWRLQVAGVPQSIYVRRIR